MQPAARMLLERDLGIGVDPVRDVQMVSRCAVGAWTSSRAARVLRPASVGHAGERQLRLGFAADLAADPLRAAMPLSASSTLRWATIAVTSAWS